MELPWISKCWITQICLPPISRKIHCFKNLWSVPHWTYPYLQARSRNSLYFTGVALVDNHGCLFFSIFIMTTFDPLPLPATIQDHRLRDSMLRDAVVPRQYIRNSSKEFQDIENSKNWLMATRNLEKNSWSIGSFIPSFTRFYTCKRWCLAGFLNHQRVWNWGTQSNHETSDARPRHSPKNQWKEQRWSRPTERAFGGCFLLIIP